MLYRKSSLNDLCTMTLVKIEVLHKLFKLQESYQNTAPANKRSLKYLLFTLYHGIRTPNEAFFHRNPKLLGFGRQIGLINFGAFVVFSAKLSAPILVQWVPCPCFPLFNHYFYKKISLYIHIPNIYLGLNLGRKELGI